MPELKIYVRDGEQLVVNGLERVDALLELEILLRQFRLKPCQNTQSNTARSRCHNKHQITAYLIFENSRKGFTYDLISVAESFLDEPAGATSKGLERRR
jgi:hypothetical protein